MRKIKKTVAIMSLLCLLLLSMLSSCGETTEEPKKPEQGSEEVQEEVKDKEPIDREKFKECAEQCGLHYKEEDMTGLIYGIKDGKVDIAYLSYSSEREIESYFCEFSDEADAKSYANTERDNYSEKENFKDRSAANYIAAEYTSVTENETEYNYVCQVGCTVFTVSYSESDDEINTMGEKLIKAIGY